MIIDRRSGSDRRSVDRFRVNIKAEWKGTGLSKSGTINDISTKGCFVATSGEIEDGNRVQISLIMKNGVRLPFQGEVVNHVYEIGFGLRFVELKNEQKEFLEKLVKNLHLKFKVARR